MNQLEKELNRLRKHDFELRFKFPTEEQRQHLQVVHRDLTVTQRRRLESRKRSLIELLQDIEEGSVHPEDLDPEIIKKLENLITRSRG